jgi:hypothetical protein
MWLAIVPWIREISGGMTRTRAIAIDLASSTSTRRHRSRLCRSAKSHALAKPAAQQ